MDIYTFSPHAWKIFLQCVRMYYKESAPTSPPCKLPNLRWPRGIRLSPRISAIMISRLMINLKKRVAAIPGVYMCTDTSIGTLICVPGEGERDRAITDTSLVSSVKRIFHGDHVIDSEAIDCIEAHMFHFWRTSEDSHKMNQDLLLYAANRSWEFDYFSMRVLLRLVLNWEKDLQDSVFQVSRNCSHSVPGLFSQSFVRAISKKIWR